jgi:hypothetical protein
MLPLPSLLWLGIDWAVACAPAKVVTATAIAPATAGARRNKLPDHEKHLLSFILLVLVSLPHAAGALSI